MTSTTHHVTIGRDFFAGAPRDYADPSFALVREFAQNGVDARGCTEVHFILDGDKLTVINNGEPMTRDVLFTKFLSLGGTTKGDGAANVGGFGKAKELLCFTHHSFMIKTGDAVVRGSGACYEVSDRAYLSGTTTQIVFDQSVFCSVERAVRKLAAAMKWKGRLTFNGETLPTDFDARTRRDLDGLGKVKTVKGPQQLIVRAGGIPMFIGHCNVPDTTLLIDLVGDTKRILTANRDSLRYQAREVLQAFIATIATNRRNLVARTIVCMDYGNELTKVTRAAALAKSDEAEPEQSFGMTQPELAAAVAEMGSQARASQIASHGTPAARPVADDTLTLDRRLRPVLDERFTIRNETGMKLDRAFIPETMSAANKRLMRDWTAALLHVHKALDLGGEFAIGFVFSEDAAALHEQRNGVTTYYVNPVKVARVRVTGGEFRTMRKVKLDQHDLRAFACHEVIHGAFGLREHDEEFSAKLTYCMAKVLRYKPAKIDKSSAMC